MKRICFRVDASNHVGMGHLMECMALTEAFRKKNEISIEFITNDFPPIRDIISPLAVPTHVLDPFSTEGEELIQLGEVLKKRQPDVLITDLLNRSTEYYQAIRTMAGHTAIILDDELSREVPGDIVINFSITQDPSFYTSLHETGTRYCIGPSYIPMSDRFDVYQPQQRDIPAECRSIFVNQGGSDPFSLTVKILKSLELLQLSQTIQVVLGDAIADNLREEILSMQEHLTNDYIFSWGIPHEQMLEIMAASDFAITAAGNTLYELALFGIPSVTICHHERHQAVAEAFARKGSVINLGIGTQLDEQMIASTVCRLLDDPLARTALSWNICQVVDGRGCERIVREVSMTW